MQKPIGTLIVEVILLIGALVFVAVSVWFLSKRTTQEPTIVVSHEKTKNAEDEGFSGPPTFDTDSDGLLDWEEALWGTNSRNADTDGDGTKDGEEVTLRRNPKSAGPNDSLETPILVSKSPLEKGVPLSSAGRVVSPLTNGNTTPAVSEYCTPFGKGGKTPAEVAKVQSEDPLYIFGNAVGTLIQEASSDSEAELDFWNSAAGNTKMTEALLQGFMKLAQKYDQLAVNLMAIASPEKAAGVYATFTSAYRNYAKAVHAIAETKVGSYLSGSAMTAYADATIALGHAFVDMSDLFYREGVRFDKTMPGAIFMFPR